MKLRTTNHLRVDVDIYFLIHPTRFLNQKVSIVQEESKECKNIHEVEDYFTSLIEQLKKTMED